MSWRALAKEAGDYALTYRQGKAETARGVNLEPRADRVRTAF